VYPVNWWYHEDQSDSDETEVVVNGEILDENSFRMTLIGNDLVIHEVLPSDTGIYTCVDNTGFGEQHKISLTVSGFMFFLLHFSFLSNLCNITRKLFGQTQYILITEVSIWHLL